MADEFFLNEETNPVAKRVKKSLTDIKRTTLTPILSYMHHNIEENLQILLDTENRGSTPDEQLLVLETLVDKIKKGSNVVEEEEDNDNNNKSSCRVLQNHLSLEDVEYMATMKIVKKLVITYCTAPRNV